MKKIFISIFMITTMALAGLVNGIAIIVNDMPITLMDIDDITEENKLSKEQAVSLLIDKALYSSEIKKHNITIDIFDIENQIQRIAQQNNMNLIEFKAAVRQQQNYEEFQSQIKKQLIHQKLIIAIAKGKLKIATQDDIKIYYDAHKEQYKIANTIDVIVYTSKNKRALEQKKLNPMQQNTQITTQNLTLNQAQLSPQVKYLINATMQNNFTSIFAQNQQYNMFFIKEKKDINIILLNQVKNKVFQELMKKREDTYLKEYFETIKLTADIKVLR